MKTIRVLLFPVGEMSRELVIADTLDVLQKLVGGYIEHVGVAPHLAVYCNEEGKLLNLPPNRFVHGVDIIHGAFLLVRADSQGDHVSLTDDDVRRWQDAFVPAPMA